MLWLTFALWVMKEEQEWKRCILFWVCLEIWLFGNIFWRKIELALNWRRLFWRLFWICYDVDWMLGIKEKRLIVEKGKENWIWRFWVELWYFIYFCVCQKWTVSFCTIGRVLRHSKCHNIVCTILYDPVLT